MEGLRFSGFETRIYSVFDFSEKFRFSSFYDEISSFKLKHLKNFFRSQEFSYKSNFVT